MTMRLKTIEIPGAFKTAASIFKKEETITSETFITLLNPIKENLYNFIFKSLFFSEDADDVYQDSIMRAFKYRGSYKTGCSFKTWIFTIAYNEIKAYFNKNKKPINALCLPLDERLNIPDDTASDSLVNDIYEVALQLPYQQQNVFFLFYDQRFSLQEISLITGLKEGNIKFILNQAREKIKQKFIKTSPGVQNDRPN